MLQRQVRKTILFAQPLHGRGAQARRILDPEGGRIIQARRGDIVCAPRMMTHVRRKSSAT